MTAWKLPEHLADILPRQARHIERLRRTMLDTAELYGYALVQPPALEYLDALTTGSGRDLVLRTFKLVDQLSGRTLGLRADTTPQVARIDAHLLHDDQLTRLCYCGSVFHTKPVRPSASREPLQFGAEIYGHDGLEADFEVLQLALHCLEEAGLKQPLVLDLGNAHIISHLIDAIQVEAQIDAVTVAAIQRALATKNAEELALQLDKLGGLSSSVADAVARLQRLLHMHGGVDLLRQLVADAQWADVRTDLESLLALAEKTQAAYPHVTITVDLADTQGYSYYSGMRFTVYAPQLNQPVLRGGRYDGVGAAFRHSGRTDMPRQGRPAVGFSMDLKSLASACEPQDAPRVVATLLCGRSETKKYAAQQQAIAELRTQGVAVACVYTQEQLESTGANERLVWEQNKWMVQSA